MLLGNCGQRALIAPVRGRSKPLNPHTVAGTRSSARVSVLKLRLLGDPCTRRNRSSQPSKVEASQQVFELADALSTIKETVSLAAGAGIIVALLWSAQPVLASKAETNERELPVDEDDAVGIKWGVMTVLSFLPLFNWLAWIFGGLEDEERAPFYYALAALYAVPQLSAGFDQNWFSIATLLAGAAHVQLERVAEERGSARAISFEGDIGEAPAEASRLISNTARAVTDAFQNSADGKGRTALDAGQPELEEDYAAEELKKWDEIFQSKDVEKDER